MGLKSKDLLGMKQLTADEIMEILDTAKTMKLVISSANKKTSHLQGKSVVTLFYENSTRTRLSFELASKYMGSASANISTSGSSVKKGESLLDTARTIDMMGTDIIIMRHNQSGAPHFIAPYLKASVVNAGDGMNEHPTQALLDMLTMYERFDTFEGKKIAICGDIYHSRVVRSNAIGLSKLGAQVSVYGPKTMMPIGIEDMGVRVADSVADCVKDADAVMGLRVQLERQQRGYFPSLGEYSRFFGIHPETLRYIKKDALIMHPGPINRGVEIDSAVADGPQSVILEQVTNGLAVRMAVLFLVAGALK